MVAPNAWAWACVGQVRSRRAPDQPDDEQERHAVEPAEVQRGQSGAFHRPPRQVARIPAATSRLHSADRPPMSSGEGTWALAWVFLRIARTRIWLSGTVLVERRIVLHRRIDLRTAGLELRPFVGAGASGIAPVATDQRSGRSLDLPLQASWKGPAGRRTRSVGAGYRR